MPFTIRDDAQLARAQSKLPHVKDAKLRAELEDAIMVYEAQSGEFKVSLEGPKPGPPIESPAVQTVPVKPTTQDIVDPQRRAIQGSLGFPIEVESKDAFAESGAPPGTRVGTTTASRVEPGGTLRALPEGEGDTYDASRRGVQKTPGSELDALARTLDAANQETADAAGVSPLVIGPDGGPSLAPEVGLPRDPYQDDGLPNLTKDTRFYTPPVSTAGSAAGRVVHLEPSMEYARALLENSPSLREQIGMAPDQELPKKLPEDVYNRVADRLYEKVYENAVTGGKQVYRYSQLEKYLDPAENRWAFAAMNAAIPAAQAALWFEQGALGGLGSAAVIDLTTGRSAAPDGQGGIQETASGLGQRLADARGQLMESAPAGLAEGFELGGAFMPWGPGAALARGGAGMMRAGRRSLPALARFTESSPPGRFAGRLAEGAAGGAAVGAGMSAATDIAAETMRGARSEPWRTPEERGIQGIFDRAASGALGGAMFGGAMSPFADVAGEAARRLRGNNRALYTLEQSGGQQDVFFTRVNKDVEAALAKYRNASKDSRAPLVIDQLTGDAFDVAVRRGKEYGNDVIVAEGQAKERYYMSPAGRQKKSPLALFNQAWAESSGTKKDVSDPDFYRLSTDAAKAAAQKLSEPVWIPATKDANGRLAPIKKPKGVVLRSPEEMRVVLGDDWMEQAKLSNPGGDVVLGVRPRPVSARTFDAIVGSLDDAARRSESGPQNTKGETPEFLARMARAAHQDREQWKGNRGKKPDPWPTWAEGMRGSSERLGDAERRLTHMGIPFSAEAEKFRQPLTAQQETAVKAKIRTYLQRDSGGGEDIDAAFDFVVNNPAERQKLLNVAQYLASEKLKAAKTEVYGGTNVKSGAGVTSSGWLGWGRDKLLYPTTKALAGEADNWSPKKGRLDLSPAVLAWLDAYVTHGAASLSGGMPARAVQPIDGLELLAETATAVTKEAYESGREQFVETAKGAFGAKGPEQTRRRRKEPAPEPVEEEEYEP